MHATVLKVGELVPFFQNESVGQFLRVGKLSRSLIDIRQETILTFIV